MIDGCPQSATNGSELYLIQLTVRNSVDNKEEQPKARSPRVPLARRPRTYLFSFYPEECEEAGSEAMSGICLATIA
eukprot:5487588-Amphidinium_carterae.1